MRDVLQDIKWAIRSAAKNPGFTVVVLLTLGIGIGANTAIFSVLHAVVLKPLPYPAAEQLVMLWEKEKDGSRSNVGYPTFHDWQAQSRAFEAMAAMSSWTPTLSGDSGEPESLEGASVTADFFRVLGVRPFLGRDFTAEDDRPNQPRIAIISYGLWQRRFGADPNLIGKAILLAGVERTVVGIMPADFQSLLSSQKTPIEIWRPLAYQGEQPPACRSCRHLRAVGRIRNGVSPVQAQAELDTIFGNIRRDHSTDYSSVGVIPEALQEEFSGDSRMILLILFGAVACVLMVACANVAGLLLSRSAARRKDIAVCIAIGAARGRIVRQLLTESMVLAAFGGGLGVLIAYAGGRLIASLSPLRLPRLEQAAADPIALAFAAGVTLLTGILFGLAPAISASAGNLHEAMKEGNRGSSRRGSRLRETLVVADVALALVLLTAAGLMLRSVVHLLNVDTGFLPANVLTMQVSVFGPQYSGDGATKESTPPGRKSSIACGHSQGSNLQEWSASCRSAKTATCTGCSSKTSRTPIPRNRRARTGTASLPDTLTPWASASFAVGD
jgi:putative ABC transport system permease protein